MGTELNEVEMSLLVQISCMTTGGQTGESEAKVLTVGRWTVINYISGRCLAVSSTLIILWFLQKSLGSCLHLSLAFCAFASS